MKKPKIEEQKKTKKREILDFLFRKNQEPIKQ